MVTGYIDRNDRSEPKAMVTIPRTKKIVPNRLVLCERLITAVPAPMIIVVPPTMKSAVVIFLSFYIAEAFKLLLFTVLLLEG